MKTAFVIFIFLGLCNPFLNQLSAQDITPDYTPYFPNFPPLTPQEMMDYAKAGAEFLEKGGDIEEFNKSPGMFTKGEFLDYRYLSIVDCETKTALAHPFVPDGVNVVGLFFKVKDINGRAYIAELCSAVSNNPEGAWIVSFVKKPGEETVDLLYIYAVKVKNTDLMVGAFSRNLKLESDLYERAREEEKILNSLVE